MLYAEESAYLVYREHHHTIEQVAWSPNSSVIASCAVCEGVKVWDARTGRTLSTYTGHSDSVRDIAFSPQEDMLATCSDDGTVHIWEAATGVLQATYAGHLREVLALTWVSDGSSVLSLDETALHLWTRPGIRAPGMHDTVMVFGREYEFFLFCLLASHDGKRVMTSSEGSLQTWDAINGRLLNSWNYGQDVMNLGLKNRGLLKGFATQQALMSRLCSATSSVRHETRYQGLRGQILALRLSR